MGVVDVKAFAVRAESSKPAKMRELEELLAKRDCPEKETEKVASIMVPRPSTRFREGTSSTKSKVRYRKANSSFGSTRKYSSSFPASHYDRSKR